MCRWLTYFGRPIHLERLLFEPENSLIKQSMKARHATVTTNGDGFGVGWYGDREIPGVYREILPAWNDPNLKSLAHQLSSRLFFAHVRASTGTETSRANCHPFTFGRWLFMHNGQIGGYPAVRRKLESMIPDGLYMQRRGTTDSEVFFLLLFANGVDDDPEGAIVRTIGQVRRAMRDCFVTEPFRMTAILSDGTKVIAVRYSCDPNPPSLFWDDKAEDMLIVSEPLDFDAGHWTEVPPAHLLVTDGNGAPTVKAFQPA